MKRQFPKTICTYAVTSILILLLASTSAKANGTIDLEEGARKIGKHESSCVPLLSKALAADTNNSGGLDRIEFELFWNSVSGGSSANIDNNGEEPSQSSAGSSLYDTLLCECHHTFGYDWSCCDDTATEDDDEVDDDDDDDGENERALAEGHWTEVSLEAFDMEDPGKKERHYQKEFCKEIHDAAEDEGIVINYDIDDVGTAVSGSTTTMATSTEAAVSTTTATEMATTTVPAEEETSSTTTSVTTTAATSTTTTTTGTTTSTTTSTTTEEEPSALVEPITLSFLGSSNGNVNADNVIMNEISHAFWTTTLGVLDDMDIIPLGERKRGRRRTRNISESQQKGVIGLTPQATKNLSGGEGRTLLMEFAEGIATYFESVVMDVQDVDCPSDLLYAAEGAPCLEFTYTLTPPLGGTLTDQAQVDEFTANFYTATDENGELYTALIAEYPDTEIVGLGNPGAGIPYEEDTAAASQSESANDAIVLQSQGGNTTKAATASGFPIGGIVGVAGAAAILALIVVALVVNKRRKSRQKESELNDSNLSEDNDANEINAEAEWFDEEHDAEHKRRLSNENSPGTSLAAMGVASTVATRLSTGDTEVMVVEKQAWSKKEPEV